MVGVSSFCSVLLRGAELRSRDGESAIWIAKTDRWLEEVSTVYRCLQLVFGQVMFKRYSNWILAGRVINSMHPDACPLDADVMSIVVNLDVGCAPFTTRYWYSTVVSREFLPDVLRTKTWHRILMETRRIHRLNPEGCPSQDIRPRVFLVAPDNPYEKRGQSGNASSTEHEELPDGQLLHLSYERFKCPEAGAGWEKEAAEAIRSWGSAFLQGSFPAHFHWAAGDRGRNCWKLHLLLRWWLMNNTYMFDGGSAKYPSLPFEYDERVRRDK